MNYRYRDKSELKQVESDWFALVPDNWNVLMFKRIVESVKNGIWGDEPKQNEDDIPCIRILNFNRNEMEVNIDDLTTRNIPILKQRDYLLKKGDLLIEKSGGGEKNPVGFVARYNHDLPAVYANFMAKISLKENEAKSEYIKYLCSNIYNKRIHLDSVNQTTGIQNLDTETYFKRFIPLPNINEQEKIAKFLDEKTAQFDSIISKKEALIEKLEEAKKSLISEVVTGKVKVVKSSDGYEVVERKKEEMKDSGVEWLGDIPIEWDISKLKYIGESITGLTYSPKDIVDENKGILVLRSSNVQNGKIVFEDNVYVDMNIPDKLITKIGDIIICSRNGSRALIGKNACIREEQQGMSFGAFMTIFRSRYFEYLNFVFNSEIFKAQSGSFLTSTINQLTISNLNSFIIPLPNFKEQNIVVMYLREKISEYDKILDNIKMQIEKLKEAKQSLISEAVTGKIEILD